MCCRCLSSGFEKYFPTFSTRFTYASVAFFLSSIWRSVTGIRFERKIKELLLFSRKKKYVFQQKHSSRFFFNLKFCLIIDSTSHHPLHFLTIHAKRNRKLLTTLTCLQRGKARGEKKIIKKVFHFDIKRFPFSLQNSEKERESEWGKKSFWRNEFSFSKWTRNSWVITLQLIIAKSERMID